MESAGQFEEHEQARMLAPLLFSFSDQDASPTINARVGKKVIWDGTPQVEYFEGECIPNKKFSINF